jgi:hypothetical protein
MNIIKIAAIATLIATPVLAQEVTFVNPGSEEGMFRQVLNDIGTTAEHTFVQANTPVAATEYFASQNVLTIWSSEWPGNTEFVSPEISNNNIVALLATETVMCSREFASVNDMSGKTVKIASWGSEPVAKFLEKFGQEHSVNFVVVPYDGSGATTRGYLGKDADTIFTIMSKEAALNEDTTNKCFAYSQNGDLAFQFVDALIGVNATTELIESTKESVKLLSQTAEWKEKFSGTSTLIEGDLAAKYQEAVVNFSK